MRIIFSAKMGIGTFEAKFVPLSKIDKIEALFVLREEKGPLIDKVQYIVLPSIFKTVKVLKVFIPFILAKYARKNKCDLIIGYHIVPHAFFAFFASLFTGIPFSCAQTGLFIQRQSKKFLFGFLLKTVLKKALFINVPGKTSKQFWTDFGIEHQKIILLHSTVDINRFCNVKTSKEFDFIILSRLSKEKRIEQLLNVFCDLKKEGYTFSVCIAGDGPKRNFLEESVRKLGLETTVKFVGFVDNPEDWFNKSKSFILSSESEGFPTALMQAMACELICVSTNVGNISDTIEHGTNGFLINYGDWGAYKETLKKILNNFNSEELYSLSKRAREAVVLNHSYDFAIQQWNKVFKQYF